MGAALNDDGVIRRVMKSGMKNKRRLGLMGSEVLHDGHVGFLSRSDLEDPSQPHEGAAWGRVGE